MLNQKIDRLSREKDTIRKSSFVKTSPVIVESHVGNNTDLINLRRDK